MSKLEQELGNPQAAGIYSLGCALGKLYEAVDSAGFALFDVDLHGIKGKQKLLDAVARAAAFPSGFGANWDAFADALCDLSWQKSAGYVLLMRNASDTLGLSANDKEIVQDIFSDTVAYWQQRNKPFWIFFA
jgi:hypothetical protein